MHEIPFHPDALDSRHCGPRSFRPLRQRPRTRLEKDIKIPIVRQTGEGGMQADVEEGDAEEPPRDHLIDRTSLCLPHFGNDAILHRGDEGFTDALRRYFPSAESNASERLVELKSKLRSASTHDFWGLLLEEMCDITGSQCGFVAKRMLVDDQDSAVEMPQLGDPGSCLMGVAFYINNGTDEKKLYRDYRYHAFGTPCSYMRHDKVFIVPERLAEFTPDNPLAVPWEAYIGLPLFTKGKCFAHFGMVWSGEGATKRKLGWSFIEMFMHSLEDMVLQRILEGRGFVKEMAPPDCSAAKIIPLSAITASQSLKPYARSLSHELRTPMQGVVGMLDIMYSTVLDAIDHRQSERVRSVFNDLKRHIEVVQDSSRRAVEAADNVVHAYDLNMQMPEMPLTASDLDSFRSSAKSEPPLSPRQWPGAHSIPLVMKRKQTEEPNRPGPPPKRMFTVAEAEIINSYCSSKICFASTGPSTNESSSTEMLLSPTASSVGSSTDRQSEQKHISSAVLSPTHRRVITREFIRSLVNESLRNGHPTSEFRTETDLGEHIHITSTGSNGEAQDRRIHLEIGPDVPEVIITEEQHLQFALQKLVDNAIKFTEHGTITITVNIARSSQVVEIRVVDTGCGISEESKSSLFKPHFQEDASISRSRDGLGLSLFNAKAHVRKNLGGDVTLERSCTHGPHKGSEFLIRLPISALETGKPHVGTPPPAGFESPRFSPLPEPSMESRPMSTDTTSRMTPTKASRQRVAFNPKLAMDYPLNILIAEDNAINRDVAIGSLNKLGYSKANITLAFDGTEAVRHYKASLNKPPAQRFSVILMDLWMPNLDGYGATTQIMSLAHRSGEAMKIIAVTADITEDSVDRAKVAGMQGFLAKPYKVFDIERLIVEHFEKCC